jgi:hypothetical protein
MKNETLSKNPKITGFTKGFNVLDAMVKQHGLNLRPEHNSIEK